MCPLGVSRRIDHKAPYDVAKLLENPDKIAAILRPAFRHLKEIVCSFIAKALVILHLLT